MTQPTTLPEATPAFPAFEDISYMADRSAPTRLARLRGFVIGRSLSECVGYLLLALLALAFLVAEVWGVWIICDLLGHAAWHQWKEWHHG